MRGWQVLGLLAVSLAGCKDPKEGVNPGECTDGADNDADGYFDCADLDCAFSPDCNGEDTDGPGTDDSDPEETDEPPGDTDIVVTPGSVASHLKSMSLLYTVEFAFDQLGNTACQGYFDVPPGTDCDCTAVYRGKGSLVEAHLDRNTYDGHFEMVSSDCVRAPEDAGGGFANMLLNDAAIFRQDPPEGYHTFRFNQDLTKVHEWVSHQFEGDNATTNKPFENNQWWMKLTVGARNGYDDDGAQFLDYAETELTRIELMVLTAKHHLEVQFSEDIDPPAYPHEDEGDTDTDP